MFSSLGRVALVVGLLSICKNLLPRFGSAVRRRSLPCVTPLAPVGAVSHASAPSTTVAVMGFKLESLHLYRKVPRDLTDATSTGGAISLLCAMVMAYLFVSNINDYLQMQTTTDVALDDTGEVHMRIFFNITMVRSLTRGSVASVLGAGGCWEGVHAMYQCGYRPAKGRRWASSGAGGGGLHRGRLDWQPGRLAAALRRGRALVCAQERLPCQFAVVDVEDIMGTSVTNVSKEILKFKVAPESGHRQEFYIDEQPSIVHEELGPEEQEMHMAMPTELPRLKDDDFERIVKAGDVSLVAFGAPWCPWSQRLEPIWRKTHCCAVPSAARPCPARHSRV